jgi:hypothetical protein
MTQVLDAQEKELASLTAQVQQFLSTDIAGINQRATQLGLPFVIVR